MLNGPLGLNVNQRKRSNRSYRCRSLPNGRCSRTCSLDDMLTSPIDMLSALSIEELNQKINKLQKPLKPVVKKDEWVVIERSNTLLDTVSNNQSPRLIMIPFQRFMVYRRKYRKTSVKNTLLCLPILYQM